MFEFSCFSLDLFFIRAKKFVSVVLMLTPALY